MNGDTSAGLKAMNRKGRNSSRSTSSRPAGVKREKRSKTPLTTAETTTSPRRTRTTPTGWRAKASGWELPSSPLERKARTRFRSERMLVVLLTISTSATEIGTRCSRGSMMQNGTRFWTTSKRSRGLLIKTILRRARRRTASQLIQIELRLAKMVCLHLILILSSRNEQQLYYS